jgi:hypothetical protein
MVFAIALPVASVIFLHHLSVLFEVTISSNNNPQKASIKPVVINNTTFDPNINRFRDITAQAVQII